MAGLVDYVVDSEKESDDEKPSNTPGRESKSASEDSASRSSPVKRSSSSIEFTDSVKPSSSKEVRDGKEPKNRDRKSTEHHHKKHKRSRSRSREKERDKKLDRERDKRRNKSKERSKDQDKSKDRDKDRNRSSHHRHRKRSRSHSRDKSQKRRKHKDDRSRHRSQSRSKSRSKSHSPNRDKNHRSSRRTGSPERREKKAARMGLDVTNVAGRLAADASSSGDEPKPTSSSSSLVQPAAQQVLQKQFTQAQQSTGVTLPSFYNPAAVNPLRVAQQMQKRKLLWSHKEKEPTATTAAKLWESTAFSQDQDGKMTAKFKRLMGIKSDTSNAAGEELSESEVLKKQKELFASLDQQYAVARAATHTQRGLGLGFSSNPR